MLSSIMGLGSCTHCNSQTINVAKHLLICNILSLNSIIVVYSAEMTSNIQMFSGNCSGNNYRNMVYYLLFVSIKNIVRSEGSTDRFEWWRAWRARTLISSQIPRSSTYDSYAAIREDLLLFDQGSEICHRSQCFQNTYCITKELTCGRTSFDGPVKDPLVDEMTSDRKMRMQKRNHFDHQYTQTE